MGTPSPRSAFPCLKGRLTVSGGSAHATGGKPLPELNLAPATPSIPLKMGVKSRAAGRGGEGGTAERSEAERRRGVRRCGVATP
jgi:hypothetical protein